MKKFLELKTERKCILGLFAVLILVSIINILPINKVTFSVEEKRELSKMPVFTFKSYMDKTYALLLENFLLDNFIFRNNFIKVNKFIKSLYSINNIFNKGSIVLLDSNTNLNLINANNIASMSVLEYSEDLKEPVVEGSYLLYQGKPYFTGYTIERKYKETLNVINYNYNNIKNEKFIVMPVPTRSAFIDDKNVIKLVGNQKENLNKYLSLLNDDIIKVNCYDILDEHKNEYIYYNSDHHWTHLGCYYGYVEYCKMIGIKPYDLSFFNSVILTDNYVGTVYPYTLDERTKKLKDIAYAYLPKSKVTLTNYNFSDDKSVYEDIVVDSKKGYDAFIGGDSKLCIIDSENPNCNKTLLVFKDSYANGMVTYLAEHYKKIILFDPRYSKMSFLNYIDYCNEKYDEIDDILILTHYFENNFSKWPEQLCAALAK